MTMTYQNTTTEPFTQRLQEKKVLIAAHRGISGGNIIGNTIPGLYAALQMGADILEFDVIKSTDGKFYVFHDGTEPFHLKINKNIKTLSSKRIDALRYYNPANFHSEFGVERLENILEEFRGKALMNIDRAWDVFPELLDLLEAFNLNEQVLIKAPVHKNVLNYLDSCGRKYLFMPIIKRYQEIDAVLSYQHLNLIAMELVTVDQKDRLFQDETIARVKEHGLFAWVNAVTFNKTHLLFGGLDDNTSIIEGPDLGWGKLIDKGFDVILTDWTCLLFNYREKRFG